MRRALVLMIPLALFHVSVLAQNKIPDIERYLARVEKGEADAVRGEIPSLLSKFPNNPGVLFLRGVLTTDGTQAVRIYQSVVDNFPTSEWADDALYKVYQFYYAIGLYRTAEIKLNQLKSDYPQFKSSTDALRSDTKSLPEENPETTKTVTETAIQNPPPPASKPAMPESEPLQPVAEEKRQYTLQVGAFSQQVNAEKQRLFFEDLGYSVEVVNTVRDSRSLFVVLVGEYKTSDEAKLKGEEFKKKYNINSMMVTK